MCSDFSADFPSKPTKVELSLKKNQKKDQGLRKGLH